MESKIKHSYDALLALRAPGSIAVTATGATPSIDLNKILHSPYNALLNRFGTGAFDLVVFVSALDTTSGTETYSLEFQTTDVADANPTTQESLTLTAAMVGVPLVFGFHPDTLQAVHPAADNFRVHYTLGGATPSLTFWAFMSPLSHA